MYEGSIIMVYDLSADENLSKDDLEKTQTEAFANGDISLSNPVLDVEV